MPLNILYLINRTTYLTKMSQVRIHNIKAISKLENVSWWGIGWDEYDSTKSVQENINNKYKDLHFDVVIVYKPLELIDFYKIKYTKCITYNEMYDFYATLKEIEESMVDLVICHHENDMPVYEEYYKSYHGQKNKYVKFVHIPHSAEESIFKDYGIEKVYDVLVTGRLNCKNTVGESHYPLRDRMSKLIEKMPSKYTCAIHKHPKSVNTDSHTDKYLIEFARAINSAKICVSCSGLPKSRFGKYIEIPMCNSVHCADIPEQDEEDFNKMLIVIDMNMSDNEIITKLVYYLEHNDELEKLKKIGYDWSKNYTQQKYAERFINAVCDFKNNNLKHRY